MEALMDDARGSNLDTVTLEQWEKDGTIPAIVRDTDGLAQEIRDAIPDDQMPDGLDSALYRLS